MRNRWPTRVVVVVAVATGASMAVWTAERNPPSSEAVLAKNSPPSTATSILRSISDRINLTSSQRNEIGRMLDKSLPAILRDQTRLERLQAELAETRRRLEAKRTALQAEIRSALSRAQRRTLSRSGSRNPRRHRALRFLFPEASSRPREGVEGIDMEEE